MTEEDIINGSNWRYWKEAVSHWRRKRLFVNIEDQPNDEAVNDDPEDYGQLEKLPIINDDNDEKY